MPALFVARPGHVVAFSEVGPLPLTLFMDGWAGYPAMRAIVTQIRVQSQGGLAVMHNMRDYTSFIVFGERSGIAQVSGMAFSDVCGALPGGRLTGVDTVAQYYNRFRITRTGRPIRLQIGLSGAARLKGLLRGASLDISNAEAQLSQFTLEFAVVP